MPGYKALIWTRCLRAAKRGYLPSTCFAIFIGSTASTCFLLVDVATTSKQCAIKWGPRCCFDPTCWTHSCWWCTENSVTLSWKCQLSDLHAGEMAVCIQFPDPRLQLSAFFWAGLLEDVSAYRMYIQDSICSAARQMDGRFTKSQWIRTSHELPFRVTRVDPQEKQLPLILCFCFGIFYTGNV